jgi:deazaflavin-dependent oxidoreductase (nitroreductase family)
VQHARASRARSGRAEPGWQVTAAFTRLLSTVCQGTESAIRKEHDVTTASSWNDRIIADFRANEGRVGGQFEGAPVVLLHHRGRKSGQEYVSPVMYLADASDRDIVYVFATKGGAPSHPDWYYNLTAASTATIELGTETYDVTVSEVTGEARDRIYDEQARRYPGFAEYAVQTAGVRTIPVLALSRQG